MHPTTRLRLRLATEPTPTGRAYLRGQLLAETPSSWLRLAGHVLELAANGDPPLHLRWPEWFPLRQREDLVRVLDVGAHYATGGTGPDFRVVARFFGGLVEDLGGEG